MAAVPEDVRGPSDAELADAVRAGRIAAYGTLYERHVAAARNLAGQVSQSADEADDLVAEAFARVLAVLRAGRGPESAFRAYLLTALRHIAYDRTRDERRFEWADDVTEVTGVDLDALSEPFHDPAVAELERGLAARAFAQLPERWQAALWYLEIEGQSLVQVAPLFGLTRNAMAALAFRAREGLRQAYLQAHLADPAITGRCRATAERLGAWTRDGLSRRDRVQVQAHLDHCVRCRELAADLADVNSGLRVVAILVLGTAASGYLGAARPVAVHTAGTSASVGLGHQMAGVGLSVAALTTAVVVALLPGQASPPSAAGAPPVTTTTVPATGSSFGSGITSGPITSRIEGPNPTAATTTPQQAQPAATPDGPAVAGAPRQPPVMGATPACRPGVRVNFRWHYQASGSAGGWSATQTAPCPGTLRIGPQAMEGNLTVTPGTPLRVGYDFTLPGNKTALTVTVDQPRVVFTVLCVSGATPTNATIVVPMPTQSYPLADDQWHPSGDQNSPLAYQGTVTVPDLCGGGPLRLSQGGTFTMTLT